jgi:hypothetical protein
MPAVLQPDGAHAVALLNSGFGKKLQHRQAIANACGTQKLSAEARSYRRYKILSRMLAVQHLCSPQCIRSCRTAAALLHLLAAREARWCSAP